MTKKKVIEKMGIVISNLPGNLTRIIRTPLNNIMKNRLIIMIYNIGEEEGQKVPKIKKLSSKKHSNLSNRPLFSSKLQWMGWWKGVKVALREVRIRLRIIIIIWRVRKEQILCLLEKEGREDQKEVKIK